MKFIFDGGNMVLANALVDGINYAGDKVIGAEVRFVLKPIVLFVQQTLIECGHWIYNNLPDIIGYSAIGAGIFIILSVLAGKGMMKPLGWFGGAFALAVCILGGE